MLLTCARQLPPQPLRGSLLSMLRLWFLISFLLTWKAWSDVPLPPPMLQPNGPAEAWNVIRLASANVDRLVKEHRPLEVPPQISLLSPALRTLAKSPANEGFEASLDELTAAAFQQVNLIAKEAMAENNAALDHLFKGLRDSLTRLAEGFEPEVVNAEVYHCIDHPDFIKLQPGETCPHCQKAVQPRRIPYSFVYARAERPIVILDITYSAPRLTIKLHFKDGTPVRPTDLWSMHTQLVQVLAVGAGYQHLTAAATETPGEYVCDFIPEKPGSWRFHVGFTPARTGLPEYPWKDVDIGEATPTASFVEEESRTVDEAGYRFALSVAGTQGNRLRAGRLQALHLQVQDASGQPFSQLEPFQQAFAHIDAFYTGSDTLLQLHPVGGDILREDVRGGPGLSFRIYSPKAGWLVLYCRVKINGKIITARHQLLVEP